jgi:hypothetical protein
MPDKNTTRRKARPKLNKEHYAIYWLLHHAFDIHGEEQSDEYPTKIEITAHGHADYVWGRVRALAKLAGITHDLAMSPRATNGRAEVSTVFDDAMKAVYMRGRAESDYDTAPAFRIAERIRAVLSIYERVRASARAARPSKGKASRKKKARGCDLYSVAITSNHVRCCGLVAGDAVEVTRADDLKAGEVAGVLTTDDKEECFFIGRVTDVSDRHITIQRENAAASYFRSEVFWLGRVDHLNPTKEDPLSEADRKRVDELREKLDDLGREDDQILRCTARYRYEREIFDIEHPADDPDDWSAWVEAA